MKTIKMENKNKKTKCTKVQFKTDQEKLYTPMPLLACNSLSYYMFLCTKSSQYTITKLDRHAWYIIISYTFSTLPKICHWLITECHRIVFYQSPHNY